MTGVSQAPDWRVKRLPEVYAAFKNASAAVYKDGALDRKTKEIIAVVVSSIMRCKECTEGHLKRALQLGATKDEVAEALSVAWSLAGATQVYWNEELQKYLE